MGDLRMRFQSGIAGDLDDPNSTRKPRLAVTTRTLEALIRLATAHAKLKLRKEEVLKEDVIEAYKLMLAAREEEAAEQTAAPPPGTDDAPAPVAEGDEPAAKRRRRGDGQSAVDGELSKTQMDRMTSLVAKVL